MKYWDQSAIIPYSNLISLHPSCPFLPTILLQFLSLLSPILTFFPSFCLFHVRQHSSLILSRAVAARWARLPIVLPMRHHLASVTTKPPFVPSDEYHRFSTTHGASDQQPDAIFVRSPVSFLFYFVSSHVC